MAAPAPLPSSKASRVYARGGSPNVVALGLERRWFSDLYHSVLTATWPRFIGMIVALYFVGNALFAVAYMLEGGVENAQPGSFRDAFFFSVQTMATIGYGKMVPHSTFANMLVTLEALSGVLGFAMATSLSYARFARPTAKVMFSRVAVVTVRDGVPSLIFRLANQRGNEIVEGQLRVSMIRTEKTREGEPLRRVHDMRLVRDHFAVFAMTWTAVHPITPERPLHGETPQTLAEQEIEILVSLTGTDATFSQSIFARWSYVPDEIVWNARLVDILQLLPDGRRAVDYGKFHDVAPISDKTP